MPEKIPEKPWTLSVSYLSKITGLHLVRYRFLSNAQTVDEAFDAIYSAGFTCVNKNQDGEVKAAGNLLVRLSAGEF